MMQEFSRTESANDYEIILDYSRALIKQKCGRNIKLLLGSLVDFWVVVG